MTMCVVLEVIHSNSNVNLSHVGGNTEIPRISH